MDILRTRLVAWALDRAQGDGRYTIPYLVADPDDRYGYRHRPLADRAEVYRHSGIDLQDATRLPQDPARAMGCLVRFRERRYAGINPRPAIYGGWHPSHRDTATRPDGRGRRPCPKRMPRNGGRSSTGFECRRGFMARPPTTHASGPRWKEEAR